MTTLIEGRVVDLEGQPVAGAQVIVDYSFAPEPSQGGEAVRERKPSVAVTDAAGQYSFTSETHPELEKQIQKIRERVQLLEGKNPHDLAARATHERQASRRIIFDVNDGTIRLSDLVLEPGVVCRVLVRWSDDVPATGVSVNVWLRDQQGPHADERAGLLDFEGSTDERGVLAFGPVLDREYGIGVRASHPEGPRHGEGWTRRLPRQDPLLVTLPRGRRIRGRIVTASGQPAAGYRIAPWEERSGDPEERRVVETYADGRFEISGLAPQNAVVAIYDRLPPLPGEGARPPPRELVAAMLSARVGSPHNPLLFHEIPDGETEVGTVTLPTLGTLAVRLEDPRGDRPLSGHALWFHSGTSHGSIASHANADGIVRFRRVPLGIAIYLQATIEDSQRGELEQRFNIAEVKEETVTLRVTGAGTVVVRFHPDGAPDEPLRVRDSWAQFHQCHGLAHERGWTSELRGWVAPGVYPALHLEARGFRECVIEDLRVRGDGPTLVDVELEEEGEQGKGDGWFKVLFRAIFDWFT